jgi:hypothetical protein
VIRTLGAPFAGVVPLVEFETALFFLKNIRIPSLPHGVRLDGGGALSANAEVLRAAMADAAALPPPLAFAALAPPGAALAATRHGSLLTYSLMRGGRTCATYVFRDVYAHHEDADGCALALVASLRSKEVPLEVFYIGFLNALGAAARLGSGFSRASRKGRKVRAGVPFKALAIDALGANTQLLARWRAAGQREHAVGRGAIYLYNFVHPRMPLRAEECVCIW